MPRYVLLLLERTWKNSVTDRSPNEKPENWKGKANYIMLRRSRKRPVIECPRNMTCNASELTNSYDNKPENKESFNPSWLVKYKFFASVCSLLAGLSTYKHLHTQLTTRTVKRSVMKKISGLWPCEHLVATRKNCSAVLKRIALKDEKEKEKMQTSCFFRS